MKISDAGTVAYRPTVFTVRTEDYLLSRRLYLYAAAQPAHPWTVADLAGLACLSRSAFHERFSDIIGMPPLAYLTEHRLRLAAARGVSAQQLNRARQRSASANA